MADRAFSPMADPEFREFYKSFSSLLPQNFLDLCNNNYEGIYSYFNGLSGDDRHRILNFLRSRRNDYIVEIRSILSRGSITMVSIFQFLEGIKQYVTELEETENYRAPAASRLPLPWPGLQASYELEETESYRAPAAFRFPLHWPGLQASYAILQGADGDRAASLLQSLLQGSQAPYGILHATEMHPSGGPYAAHIHIQSLSQRPAGLYNNLPGHDGVVIIPAHDEFPSGHQTILSEVRATRDNETVGHSKLFKALLPVNVTSAYKAGKILKSTYQFLQPSIKISGYLTVAMAGTAVFSCLVGLSLSTFKPSTLPFGCNPQLMLQIMHYVAVTTTAYAFIGTMCHEFLQDDPLIMWIVEGLAAAAFMSVMVFFGRRI